MDETVFKNALSAISAGYYTQSDLEVVKERLSVLSKKELSLKREMERRTNDFVKSKRKSNSELREVRKCIKEINEIIKKGCS